MIDSSNVDTTHTIVLFSFLSEPVFPQMFDGCKFVVQKGLSKHFQTMHTLTLGSSTQPSQWQFGATYVGTKKIADNDVRGTVTGGYSVQ